MAGRKYAQRNSPATALKSSFFTILIFLISLNSCSDLYQNQIPDPILPDYQGIRNMYWKVWQIMEQNIKRGNRENNFSYHYVNCESELLINQSSTIMLALFGVYGSSHFPVMQSLDNFYRGQRSDGFISRIYNSMTGEYLHAPSAIEPMINPPLFTWPELKYYYLTGDQSRLRKYFKIWEKYFEWLDNFCQAKGEAIGLYYNSQNGSLMINSPRTDNDFGGWADMSCQMALFAEQLAETAEIIGEDTRVIYYQNRYQKITEVIREKLWHDEDGFYYDLTSDGHPIRIKTTAGFWPLIAGIPSSEDAPELINHLKNDDEFARRHLFPSLSADEDGFKPNGAYWRGGVWGNENYMIIAGLKRYGEYEFATTTAWNHITNMEKIFTGYFPDTSLIDEKYWANCNATVWELYSPENDQPGTRWDTYNLCRPNYIPTSGFGPVAMLIEDVLGFNVNGPDDQLTWRLWLLNKHGIRNLKFGNNLVTLWCEKRETKESPVDIKGLTSSPFSLTIILEQDTVTIKQPHGRINLSLKMEDIKKINKD